VKQFAAMLRSGLALLLLLPACGRSVVYPQVFGPDAQSPCPAGEILCEAGCVNAMVQPSDCGGCGQVCASPKRCIAGVCR